MADKMKQRIRSRMKRTGETYQAAWNALHTPTPTQSTKVFSWTCDICGEELLDDPSSGMVQWLYEPEPRPPLEYVGALFFCHKGTCDETIRAAARDFGASVGWEDLAAVVSEHWYEQSRQLFDAKRWAESHEERLTKFFRLVSAAREDGWRPMHDSIDNKARHARSIERERRLGEIDDGLWNRVRAYFAPESLMLNATARSFTLYPDYETSDHARGAWHVPDRVLDRDDQRPLSGRDR